MKLLLASANPHKTTEMQLVLDGLGIQVLPLTAVEDPPRELPEDGTTLQANALQKARAVFARHGVLCVADDTGLEVRALGGLPGVHSKRFSPQGTPEHNNALLLQKLAGVTSRRARFRTVLALVGSDVERVFEGECTGAIGTAPKGAHGFGYDPVFLPDDTPGQTMAELTPTQKAAIGHRGRALRSLMVFLRANRLH